MLCHECLGETSNGTYYTRSGDHGCILCGSKTIEYLKLVGLLILVIAYVCLMTMLIVRSPSRKKDDSVLLRIVTNYLQMIAMIV
jgi:hypothetical protein